MEIITTGSERALDSNQWRLGLGQSSKNLRFSIVLNGQRFDLFSEDPTVTDWMSADAQEPEIVFDVSRVPNDQILSFEITAIADGVVNWTMESLNSNDLFGGNSQEVEAGSTGVFLTLRRDGEDWVASPVEIRSSKKPSRREAAAKAASPARPMKVIVDFSPRSQDKLVCDSLEKLLRELVSVELGSGSIGLRVTYSGLYSAVLDDVSQVPQKHSSALIEASRSRLTAPPVRALVLQEAQAARGGSHLIVVTDRQFMILETLVAEVQSKDLKISTLLLEQPEVAVSVQQPTGFNTAVLGCNYEDTDLDAVLEAIRS
jgi:hypothetical protein